MLTMRTWTTATSLPLPLASTWARARAWARALALALSLALALASSQMGWRPSFGSWLATSTKSENSKFHTNTHTHTHMHTLRFYKSLNHDSDAVADIHSRTFCDTARKKKKTLAEKQETQQQRSTDFLIYELTRISPLYMYLRYIHIIVSSARIRYIIRFA